MLGMKKRGEAHNHYGPLLYFVSGLPYVSVAGGESIFPAPCKHLLLVFTRFQSLGSEECMLTNSYCVHLQAGWGAFLSRDLRHEGEWLLFVIQGKESNT